MAESTVRVVFLGDAKNLKRELDELDGATASASGGFSKFGAIAAGGLAAGAAGAIAFGKSALSAFEESRKVGAQTEAVIKSMGLASTVTADQIGDMASALSKKTGVDDEAIQSGQNLLLTFGNLAKTAGTTGGAFDRASQIMVDMSAAMGGDASSSAIQLGKALNDPITGISALTRVGVSFTEEQKEQIKAMQEAGDIAGAQALILAELERQFGGSAEAQATASDRMRVAFGNLQEDIGARLAPAFDRLAVWITEVALPAFDRLVAWVSEHWPQISATITEVMGRVQAVIQEVLAVVEAFWRTWGETITRFVTTMFDAIRQVVEGAMNVIRGVIDVVLGLIHGDWSRVWDGIRSIVEGVWQIINGVVDQAINAVRTTIEVAMRVIAGIFDAAWDGIKSLFERALAGITLVVWRAWDGIVEFIGSIPGRVVGVFESMWDTVKELASDAAEWVLRQIDRMLGPLDEIAGKLGGVMGKAAGFLPGFASGTLSAPSGLAIVGEQGPELVSLRGGERIYPAGQTRSMLGAGGGVKVVVNVNGGLGGPERIGAATADAVRRELAVLLRGAVA